MARLERWVLQQSPLDRQYRFIGELFGDPRAPFEGCGVTTSPLRAFENGVATTASGSRYELGEPLYRCLEREG